MEGGGVREKEREDEKEEDNCDDDHFYQSHS